MVPLRSARGTDCNPDWTAFECSDQKVDQTVDRCDLEEPSNGDATRGQGRLSCQVPTKRKRLFQPLSGLEIRRLQTIFAVTFVSEGDQ
jgi:hypothetical protein